MKIAIDMSQVIYGTGVSHYRENLVKNLLKIDLENEYLLYGGSFRRFKELENTLHVISNGQAMIKVLPFPPTLANIIWNKLHILPIEKLIGNFDLVHTSDWAEPPSNFLKVTTIHDLVPLKFPKLTPKNIVDAHVSRLSKWVKNESKRIIVPSLQTKSDLVDLGFREDIVRVIYEAPNFIKALDSEVLRVKSKYKIHEDYVIAIGTNPRKNVERIIDAFHLSKAGKNIKLLIVGERKGVKHEDQRGVRFLGFIPDNDLEPLLTGTKALVFPSIYEGLGVPILDGFNCEVPVVTSNIGSMKEISGGASVLVDPFDVNSIAAGIREALEKPKTLISKGLARVKFFSWQKCAEETLGVYKEVTS